LSRSQQRSTLHTRGNLPPVLEVPQDEPEVEEDEKEPLPERRVPYSLHVVSHFPNNKHLKEESRARKTIELKIVNAFANTEELIRHVEVNLQVSENFHKSQTVHDKVKEGDSPRIIAPYIFKVTVALKNGRTIVLANAEKHAQPTFSEGLDHMVDVVRNSLRDEKEKEIKLRKKAALSSEELPGDTGILEDVDAESVVDDLQQQADAKMEQLYENVERSAEAK